MSASYTSISSDKLSRLSTLNAPTLIDVRIDEDFSADPPLIPGALRRSHLDIQDWASRLTGQSVVVVCNKGQELSEGAAAWLRCSNIAAEVLEGGHVGWKDAELPIIPADKIPKRDGRGRAESKTRLTVAAPASPPPALDLDTAQLDQIIGVKGHANGGVYQFGVPRRDPIKEDGMALSPVGPLGVATGIGFQPTGSGKAAITGDFVLTGDEVNPPIMALKTHGIELTALHSHMLDEEPRLFFMSLMTMRSSSRRACVVRSTRPRAQRAEAAGTRFRWRIE